jgi:hypothetical protein
MAFSRPKARQPHLKGKVGKFLARTPARAITPPLTERD